MPTLEVKTIKLSRVLLYLTPPEIQTDPKLYKYTMESKIMLIINKVKEIMLVKISLMRDLSNRCNHMNH